MGREHGNDPDTPTLPLASHDSIAIVHSQSMVLLIESDVIQTNQGYAWCAYDRLGSQQDSSDTQSLLRTGRLPHKNCHDCDCLTCKRSHLLASANLAQELSPSANLDLQRHLQLGLALQARFVLSRHFRFQNQRFQSQIPENLCQTWSV